LEAGDIQMQYKKINVELIVVADEAEAVVAELNAALDRLEKRHTLFGGGIETVAFEHPGTRKRLALAHTMAAGETVAVAVRAARESVTVALPQSSDVTVLAKRRPWNALRSSKQAPCLGDRSRPVGDSSLTGLRKDCPLTARKRTGWTLFSYLWLSFPTATL
jgi:hypothetical protein